ncbi:MAG: AraC family transcriptional regulator [Lachnospiraceae bacterium]|nr:AraC family transcriptional regulator [Lachnospiraceae bacterium]
MNKKRIRHALFLLNTTSLQIQVIAQSCGIPDVNYFTKTFRKYVGKTPKEYRNQITSHR